MDNIWFGLSHEYPKTALTGYPLYLDKHFQEQLFLAIYTSMTYEDCAPVNNTSVHKYWKILFYPPNTDTGTFYGGSTDIDTDAQYPKCSTDILVFPVFYSISILCFKPLIDSYYLRLLSI